MSLRFVTKSPGFMAGSYGPLVISVWESQPTLEQARQASSVLASTARTEDKLLVTAIVGRDTPPPDSSVRDIVAAEMTRTAPNIAGMAQVIEGAGFRAATMRAVLTGMGIVIKPSYPQKVFPTVEDAASFLAGHSNGRLTSEAIVRAVRQLRDA